MHFPYKLERGEIADFSLGYCYGGKSTSRNRGGRKPALLLFGQANVNISILEAK